MFIVVVTIIGFNMVGLIYICLLVVMLFIGVCCCDVDLYVLGDCSCLVVVLVVLWFIIVFGVD